jgi:hypothetical protein
MSYPEIVVDDRSAELLDGATFVDGVAGPVSGLITGQELWRKGEDKYLVWDYRYGDSGTGSGTVSGPYTYECIADMFPWLIDEARS